MIMDVIQIISYILYAILLFITIMWALGIRIKPVVCPTVITGFYFLVVSLIFSFTEINKIHLVWIIPLIYLSSFVSIYLIQRPVISTLLKIICSIYAGILRIGKK